MFIFQSFATVLAFFAACTHASPLSYRDVIAPTITSPTADSVWPVGSVQTVTWDTSNLPPVSQITNILGQIILGFNESDSLNLDFNNPLAKNFNLTDGSVNVTVPNVTPRDDYLIVLFGDSGDTSPAFSITRISAPGNSSASIAASSSAALATTPIPATGSALADESSATDNVPSTTPSATGSSSAPLTTATSPSTIISSTGSTSSTGSATAAFASTTANAAWSLHEPTTTSFRALSVCMAAMITFIMV